jgi:hypothetical protein
LISFKYSSSGYWGAYPTLTSSYGQYDNGPQVFVYYYNFNGTSLISVWQEGATGGTITINDGLTLIPGSSVATSIITKSEALFNPQTQVADFDTYSANYGNNPSASFAFGYTNGNNYAISGDPNNNEYALVNYNSECPCEGAYTDITAGSTSTYNVFSIHSNSIESLAQFDYGVTQGSSSDYLEFTASGLFYYVPVVADGTGSTFSQWVRVRIMPPNDLIPSSGFGTLISY